MYTRASADSTCTRWATVLPRTYKRCLAIELYVVVEKGLPNGEIGK